MRWATWQNVAVDRIGCAWLIRRFIDSQAEFSFITYGTKPGAEDGEPFDIPAARLSHRGGKCTFSTMISEYDLHDPILERIARIIDEADIVQEVSVEPTAAGLDSICRGIRLTSDDDQIAIDRGALVYDALYAQLKAEQNPPAADRGGSR